MLRGCETPSPLPLASARGARLCTLDKDTWVETWTKVWEVSQTQHCKGDPAPVLGGTKQSLCAAFGPSLPWGWGYHQVVMLKCCVTHLTWRALDRAWQCWCWLSLVFSAFPQTSHAHMWGQVSWFLPAYGRGTPGHGASFSVPWLFPEVAPREGSRKKGLKLPGFCAQPSGSRVFAGPTGLFRPIWLWLG